MLAAAVQRRMLGESVSVDDVLDQRRPQRQRSRIASDSDIGARLYTVRKQLDDTVHTLNLTPASVHRVVRTELRLQRQENLRPVDGPTSGTYAVPTLTGSWARAAAGLAHPLRPEQARPVAFDPAVAKDREDDVVLAT